MMQHNADEEWTVYLQNCTFPMLFSKIIVKFILIRQHLTIKTKETVSSFFEPQKQQQFTRRYAKLIRKKTALLLTAARRMMMLK